jgi:hypothetical protein
MKEGDNINITLVLKTVIIGSDEYSNTFGDVITLSMKEYNIKGLKTVNTGSMFEIKNLGLIRVDKVDYDSPTNTVKLISFKRLDA